MSAKNRKHRDTGEATPAEAHENYPTPDWCVERLLESGALLPLLRDNLASLRFLEPCAGDGAIIRAAGAYQTRAQITARITWDAVDIQHKHFTALLQAPDVDRVRIDDFLRYGDNLPTGRYDAIVTNPPFSLAIPFLDICLRLAPVVCFLLRLGFLSSKDRHLRLLGRVPDVNVLPNRPRFVRGQSDNSDYAWMVWGREPNRHSGRVRILRLTEKPSVPEVFEPKALAYPVHGETIWLPPRPSVELVDAIQAHAAQEDTGVCIGSVHEELARTVRREADRCSFPSSASAEWA